MQCYNQGSGTTVLPTPPPLAMPDDPSPQAMLGRTLMPSIQVLPRNYSTAKDGVQVLVETISPEDAANYLKKNFSDNRKMNISNVNKWSVDMKRGRWKLSTDCIAFDIAGRLINGQNRLTAVEKAGVPVQFLVARNFPKDSVAVLDLGKRRMMHERITIAGEPLTSRECSVIRNAMSPWHPGHRMLGTMAYAQIKHDEKVVKAYNDHKLFLKLMDAAGYMHTQIPGFFVVAALYIYAEGVLMSKNRKEGQDPLRRAMQFLEIVNTGTLEHAGTFKRDRDGAALLLRETYQRAKAQRKHWSTFSRFAQTLVLAKNFEIDKNISYIKECEENPFMRCSICDYESTNSTLINHIVNANYLGKGVAETMLDKWSV